jgi:hypothetical protein
LLLETRHGSLEEEEEEEEEETCHFLLENRLATLYLAREGLKK